MFGCRGICSGTPLFELSHLQAADTLSVVTADGAFALPGDLPTNRRQDQWPARIVVLASRTAHPGRHHLRRPLRCADPSLPRQSRHHCNAETSLLASAPVGSAPEQLAADQHRWT